ncbi:rhodanese-like domain-containing protein [Hoyosella sp. G463]|uniref:Rhodanese-like domain-containing protein n=1 Tax=Lolliginicoccus lacisalsi TaxID=2742202 RepID=A0A927JEM0_9ACTN|nr:rhodanese-like domain-containing protein [Lolliginicoccus lacisalsi]MBD8506967.1 rhodanese-like domain-containing protein [Lolliginicoccus lacisalsi]
MSETIPSEPAAEIPDAGDGGVTIVDVREQDEWDQGHAPGALHIPMVDMPARYGEIDPDDDIYVVCRNGGRSFQVTLWLQSVGYDATNVSGGMVAWQKAGRAIESADGGSGYIY